MLREGASGGGALRGPVPGGAGGAGGGGAWAPVVRLGGRAAGGAATGGGGAAREPVAGAGGGGNGGAATGGGTAKGWGTGVWSALGLEDCEAGATSGGGID